MNHDTCSIVRDIMPLVIDSAASEASQALVNEHIAACPECRQMMEDMRSEMGRQPKPAEADAKFIALCLNVRRSLRRRKTRLRLLCLALALCLLAGGAAFIRYKIAIDTRAYKPDTFTLSVNRAGELVLDYTHSRLFAAIGWEASSYGEGVYLVCPTTTAWPNLFQDGGTRDTLVLDSFFIQDGNLFYESWDDSAPIITKDREQGTYTEQYALRYDAVKELRIGTPDDYTVAYRSGDVLSPCAARE